MAKQLPPSKVLNYSVHSSSGYSASYAPENVRLNCPADQASRWSSASNDQNQFLLLEILDEAEQMGPQGGSGMALLESIGFGKFQKVHVCNLKEFKVFAGPSLDSLHLILHTGLNNDTIPESFPPDYSLSFLPAKLPFPIKFVKIVPLAAWGSNFNFSVWYVELRGWTDNSVSASCSGLVKATWEEYNRVKEHETTRMVLKFLRQHRHMAAFSALQEEVPVQLEAPAVSQLHDLINQNRFNEAEDLLVSMYTADPTVFDEYIHTQVPYEVHWTRLDDSTPQTIPNGLDENGDYRMMDAGPLRPSARGGHQMLWDPRGRKVYLFGGWDGKRDLADFWSFDPQLRAWSLISMNVERDGGPPARSCHKAVLHTTHGHIYILGRYIDPERRTDPLNLPCDFYRYTLADGTWTRLSGDVRSEGGPGCIYDHQMIIDEEEDCLWVFGGRLLSGTNEQSVYSGLYRHDLKTAHWTLVQSDSSSSDSGSSNGHLPPMRIPSRIGHSMLFDPIERSLLLLAGQRYKDQLADFYKYSTDRQCITQVWKNLQLCSGPEAGLTQRAVIDPLRREMYVFSSLVRGAAGFSGAAVVGVPPAELETGYSSNSGDETGAFWCFDLSRDKWTRISSPSTIRPPARFAHQFVYDPLTQSHFLFGGNPGNPLDPSARLDDLWCAQLRKSVTPAEVLRSCQYLIRKRIFEAILANNSDVNCIPTALKFLQNDLAVVVNHANPQESAAFRALSAKLFEKHQQQGGDSLFNDLVTFLPKSMQPPTRSL